MNVINQTKKISLSSQCEKADNPLSRMKGLIGKSCLEEGKALLITQCNSIHMFFMQFAIDAVFADRNNKVVGLVKNIRPWQLSPLFFKASYVIEFLPGIIEATQTEIGDQLLLES